MVAVATNLAHDGIASPVASLEDGGRKGSYGVQMPIAVVVDLDYVRRSEPGDAPLAASATRSRNLSAIADWRLAERERGEPVDGVAVTFARTAATSVLHREDGDRRRRLPDRAGRGARAVRAGDGDRRARSRPCSGGDHEILHAIDHLFPGTAQPRRAGRRRRACSRRFLRGDDGAGARRSTPACAATGCRARPADLGLTDEQFAEAVVARAATRARTATRSSSTSPSTTAEVRRACPRVRRRLRSLSCARRRSRRRIFERNSGEHWAGRLYMRRFSPYLTRLLLRTPITPERA